MQPMRVDGDVASGHISTVAEAYEQLREVVGSIEKIDNDGYWPPALDGLVSRLRAVLSSVSANTTTVHNNTFQNYEALRSAMQDLLASDQGAKDAINAEGSTLASLRALTPPPAGKAPASAQEGSTPQAFAKVADAGHL